MSGHSKWSTIKRAKGKADAKRGTTFTKIGNNIALAAKESNSGDFDSSPKLRLAVEAARGVNMPKENIQRAIDRGLGRLPGQTFEKVLYEGFGPSRVAFIVSGVTDNRNRTLSEVKNIFDRTGGGLGSTGSVSYLFDKVAELKIISKGGEEEDEELELIDLGIDDVESFLDEDIKKYIVYGESTKLSQLQIAIGEAGFKVESAEIIYKPNSLVEISDKETAEKVLNFTEKLEDYDDTQKVFANFEIADDLMSEI